MKMAETSVASNNKSVSFRNKPEREMSTHQRMNAEGQKVDGGESMGPRRGMRRSGRMARLWGLLMQREKVIKP
jgi:hypothetical protein